MTYCLLYVYNQLSYRLWHHLLWMLHDVTILVYSYHPRCFLFYNVVPPSYELVYKPH